MKAFISYSHQDEGYLNLLHRHLAQLRRDNLIQDWTDKRILAGAKFDSQITSSLEDSQLFLGLISPDYLSSNYCYEKEFQTAREKQEQGVMIIVPIIVEPCDWKSTPFSDYKALPKDGKPVSEWSNKNNAMLDVIQNIRRLISGYSEESQPSNIKIPSSLPANFKVKKDFDSLQKMDFLNEGFKELKRVLEKNVEEIDGIENIKTRILVNNEDSFEALIVNRNKIKAESKIKIVKGNLRSNVYAGFGSSEYSILYSFDNDASTNFGYGIHWDDFELFWTLQNNFYGRNNEKLSIEEIANEIWLNWLEKVDIVTK